MLKKLFIFALFFASLVLQGCDSAVSQSSNSEVKSETPQPQKELSTQQKVNFKGMSFSYNPQIFGEVKSEEIAQRPLEDETHKPDYIAPQHILFTLKKPGTNRETVIYIFPIEDYRRMYPLPSKHQNYREQFDEELKGLQKVIKDKNYRKENQIPFIPFWDGSQTFQAKVKHSSSQNGKGIFFLTQIDFETTLVSNEGLIYCFEGISSDGKNYILAQFPLSVSFLPKNYEADEFEGYKLSSAYSANEPKGNTHEDYVLRIAKRLDNLKPDEFEPNLNQIEEIISSLKVEYK